MQPSRVSLIHIPASSHHNSCIFSHFASICCSPVVPFVKNWNCCLHHYEWYSIHFLFYLSITANLDFDIYFNKPKLSVQSHPLQWCVSSDRSSDADMLSSVCNTVLQGSGGACQCYQSATNCITTGTSCMMTPRQLELPSPCFLLYYSVVRIDLRLKCYW